MSSPLNISKEWLESILSEKVESFEVSAGSNPGDNYLGVMYAIEVKFSETEKPPAHIVLKSFPLQSTRQEMLSASNSFHKEVQVYNAVLPELIKFQEDHKNLMKSDEKIIPPFPKFLYGKSMDFQQKAAAASGPLDNCVVMNDLRKDGGFRLADRLIGFDIDHCRLVTQAQAKLHALSWAYKKVTGTGFNEKFPFLKSTIFDSLKEMTTTMAESHYGMASRAIENHLGDEDAQLRANLIKSVEQAKVKNSDVLALYFCDDRPLSDPSITKNSILRVPPESTPEDEVEWLCLIHGDAWSNNQMFRYDEQGKPIEVILVDLQLVREGNPMTDLTYSIYTSTSSEFRKAHLDELLQLYYRTFNEICEKFDVSPFPGFSLSELKRRFHQAKAFGFVMTIFVFPLILSDPEEAKDMETLESTDMNEVFNELISSNPVENQLRYKTRVTDLVKDLYEEGVI